MRVDPVTKVMEKSRQNDTLMLVFGEWQSRLLRKATNMEFFVIRRQSFHLLIAEICCPQTMLESIMNGSWEHHIVRPKLVDVFEALHSRLINEEMAVLRQGNLIVDNVLNGPRLEHTLTLIRHIIAHLDIAALQGERNHFGLHVIALICVTTHGDL